MFKTVLCVFAFLASFEAFSQFNPIRAKNEALFLKLNNESSRLTEFFNGRSISNFNIDSDSDVPSLMCGSTLYSFNSQFFVKIDDNVKYGVFVFKGYANKFYTAYCDENLNIKIKDKSVKKGFRIVSCIVERSTFNEDGDIKISYVSENTGIEIFNCKTKNVK